MAGTARAALSGVGGNLQIDEQPMKLYRRAARQTLQMVGGSDPAVIASIEKLLLWRDNGWQEMEELLVNMVAQRDRWMHCSRAAERSRLGGGPEAIGANLCPRN